MKTEEPINQADRLIEMWTNILVEMYNDDLCFNMKKFEDGNMVLSEENPTLVTTIIKMNLEKMITIVETIEFLQTLHLISRCPVCGYDLIRRR